MKFSYKGFSYVPFVEEEDDNRKVLHDVVTPEGLLTYVSWSPYSPLTEKDFQLWVDAGCPKGKNGGNLTQNDLQVTNKK